MGCSNPHPHGQIWARRQFRKNLLKELGQQNDYFQKNGRTLLGDYLDREIKEEERLVKQLLCLFQ